MKRYRTGVVILAFLFLVNISPLTITVSGADDGIATLRQTSKAFTSVAKKAVPAVVSVQVIKTVKLSSGYGQSFLFEDEFFERFFGLRPQQRSPREQRQTRQGSGFIISADGYILTNNHVVGDADEITVILTDGRKFEKARIVGTDPGSDVAVIKIDGKDLPFIEFGDSDKLEIGEWVIAIGNPFGLTETVTVGVVSAKGRKDLNITEGGYEDFIQTDAAINPGNSGGPMLNLDGEAVGINSAILSRSGGYMGIGFAIPINMARTIKDQLIKSGKVTRGYLGVYMGDVTDELVEPFGLDKTRGVIITRVFHDSPAEKANLKAGDIILKINDAQIKDSTTFRETIASVGPGTTVKLLIYRDGKEKTVKVTIGEKSESKVAQDFGLSVQVLTEGLAERYGYELAEGVIVSEVKAGSVAAEAGIKIGMLIISVNHKHVTTVEGFKAAFEESIKSRKALVLIRNERFAWYEALTLD